MSHLHRLDLPYWPFDEDFFTYVDEIKNKPITIQGARGPMAVALLFFEPSTRTYLSFQRAVSLLGGISFGIQHPAGTSLEKGESLDDTILNVASMLPDVVVIRAGDTVRFEQWMQMSSVPLICAGWGRYSHPTQALLDSYTLYQVFHSLKGRRLLYVGDGLHSRVLASHRQWFRRLGAQLAYLMPESWLPESRFADELVFQDKKTALSWAEVVIALRYQKERWRDDPSDQRSTKAKWNDQAEWLKDFSIHKNDLDELAQQPWLMHPGPVGWGMELDPSVRDYSKNLILKQVENGVWVRKAVLHWCMQGVH